MTGRIVRVVEGRHDCQPPELRTVDQGTIWECADCRRRWIVSRTMLHGSLFWEPRGSGLGAWFRRRFMSRVQDSTS